MGPRILGMNHTTGAPAALAGGPELDPGDDIIIDPTMTTTQILFSKYENARRAQIVKFKGFTTRYNKPCKKLQLIILF